MLVVPAFDTGMIDRLPPRPPERWTDAQRVQAEAMIAGPRGAVVAPFVPLLRSPELAILVTSAHYRQPVEWAIHAPIALREGIAQNTTDAIDRDERPSGMPDDEALLHDYCRELLQGRGQVGDALWARATERFGEQGMVDLTATCG
jgi:4-carboxymuconolactone decarboxylase